MTTGYQYSVCPGLQIQDGHPCRIEAAGQRGDREQHRPSPWQPFGKRVIGFPVLGVGPRQHCRWAACCRDSLQARGSVAGREDDGVIRAPCGAGGRRAVDRRDSRRRPAVDEHLLQRARVREPNPLAVRRHERSARQTGEHGHGIEGIQGPNEELRAAVADIDDARAVRRDRHVALTICESQRGGTRRDNLQPRDARRDRFSRTEEEPYTAGGRDGSKGHGARGDRRHAAPTRRASRNDRCRCRRNDAVESAFQRETHVLCISDSLFRILLQTASDAGAEPGRKSRRKPAPVRLPRQHRRQHFRYVVSRKCARACQHLVQHAAERPDVGALVDRFAARLLRAHVRGGAENHAERPSSPAW